MQQAALAALLNFRKIPTLEYCEPSLCRLVVASKRYLKVVQVGLKAVAMVI